MPGRMWIEILLVGLHSLWSRSRAFASSMRTIPVGADRTSRKVSWMTPITLIPPSRGFSSPSSFEHTLLFFWLPHRAVDNLDIYYFIVYN